MRRHTSKWGSGNMVKNFGEERRLNVEFKRRRQDRCYCDICKRPAKNFTLDRIEARRDIMNQMPDLE
jgi:hypothetical protein